MALDTASSAPQAWANWNFNAGSLDLVECIKSIAQSGPSAWARVVGTRDDLEATNEEGQLVPGVYVIYRGPVFKEANDHKAEVEHRWLIVVAVAGPVNTRESGQKDAEAGKYLPLLMQSLHGYIPAGCTTALVPETPPSAKQSGRYGYYPLAFKATTVYSIRKGPSVGPLPLDRR